MDNLHECMNTIKEKLDKENTVPDKIDVPTDVSDEARTCYRTLTTMCDKLQKANKYVKF